MSENQFHHFLQKLKDKFFDSFQIKEVFVDPEKGVWEVFFSILIGSSNSKIQKIDLFLEKFQSFYQEKTQKDIKNLKIKTYLRINDLENLNPSNLELLLTRIVSKNPNYEIFNIVKNKINNINLETKKCQLNLTSAVIQDLKKPDFLTHLQKILKEEYGFDLIFTTISEEKLFLVGYDTQNEDFNDFQGIDNSSDWQERFQFLLKKLLFEKKTEPILSIFLNPIESLDLEKKICVFNIDLLIIKFLKTKILNTLNTLKKIFNQEYSCDFNFQIKGMIKKNFSSSEIIHLSFKDIPFKTKELNAEESRELEKFKEFKIKGYIEKPDFTETKNQDFYFTFYLVDLQNSQDSIFFRKFFNHLKKKEKDYDQKLDKIKKLYQENFKEGVTLEIIANLKSFSFKEKKDFYFTFNDEKFNIIDKNPFQFKRNDNYSGPKRIEFHLHTKMSNLDGVNSAKDYIETADKWGHKAIAFTDYNGIYAYPEINKFTQKNKIKPILGVEVNFIDEKPIYITNQQKKMNFSNFVLKKHNYVVFDIETTGFSKIRDQIIEISAVKIQNGKLTNIFFNELVNPKIPLSSSIVELTGITDEDLKNKPTIEEVLPKFFKFIEGFVLVAHNITFDIGFLKEITTKLNLSFEIPPTIDTLPLAQKYFHKYLKYFSLKKISKAFKIKQTFEGKYHRALFDSQTTALVLLEMFNKLEKQTPSILTFYDLKEALDVKFQRSYHLNILAKNQIGYKNLFHLISDALTKDFYKIPLVLKSNLDKYREGLLIGSGYFGSNVFENALNENDQKLKESIAFYDYIEIQPIHAFKHIIYEIEGENGDVGKGKEIIKKTLLRIIEEARKQEKLIIATGDVYYLNPYDKIYREVYINAKLIGGGLHRLTKYPSRYLPDNYFLTTPEMLKAFEFISDSKLREDIVIHNTHLLNDQIEKIKIFPEKLFFLKDDTFAQNLKIPSIKQELKNLILNQTKILYGEKPHPLIKKRIDKEYKSIIGDDNDVKKNPSIAPIYFLTHLLAKKSIENEYPVGSRGSIGSSIIANILEITEVNPLKPHYRCSECQYTVIQMSLQEKKNPEYQIYINHYFKNEFSDNNNYDDLEKVLSGYDLPDRKCPFCQTKFKKDGQNIPFETFLGFEGNKTPDIDLNFAGDYQKKAHDYIKKLLGEENVFRAGTIQTVAKQNAYGYVKGFLNNRNLEGKIRNDEVERMVWKVEGVKRSTGQHPGGIIVVPKENSIYDVTPIQFPANNKESTWKTTHFDYHSFENNLFKIDLLGHDDPMIIKFFMDHVKKNPRFFNFHRYQDIPIDDPEVYNLFQNTKKIKNQNYLSTLAIPEFGTKFVIEMLKHIDKKEDFKFNFGTLVKVSGLSHGTDVWLKNAQDLLNKKSDISFNDIISCRDEIMNYLIEKGIEPLKAFEIMEFVRKGKQHKNIKEWEKISLSLENKIPDWYIKSLKKIKYLFPKAHATAYVLMAIRIAWFKVHHPLLFYSGFFSKRTDQFDYNQMLTTEEKIQNELSRLASKKNITAKEQNIIYTLMNTLEMIRRGYKFLPIDLNKSEVNIFIMNEEAKGLIIPFVALDGLGEVSAQNIVEARKEKLFTQIDFFERVKINKTLKKKIKDLGLIEKLPLE